MAVEYVATLFGQGDNPGEKEPNLLLSRMDIQEIARFQFSVLP